MLGYEPTIIIQTIVAVLTAIQQLTLSVPSGAHTIIAVIIVGLGAIVNRQKVTPS